MNMGKRQAVFQINYQSDSRLIPQIRNASQQLTVDPKEINETFKKYYANLYTSELAFLNVLNIHTINQIDQKERLEQPINLQEIIDSINAMQNGKTPGPHGYTVEFYKAFAIKLAPLLLKMFENSLNNAKLPQSRTEAFIILILKPGKDPLECSSYRPISLLNVDVKILAKPLASSIDTVIPVVVSPD